MSQMEFRQQRDKLVSEQTHDLLHAQLSSEIVSSREKEPKWPMNLKLQNAVLEVSAATGKFVQPTFRQDTTPLLQNCMCGSFTLWHALEHHTLGADKLAT